ncbi:ABC transporter substrate-binding protein [Aerosakkonemataceae cyanobacterium BLCC-F154]|uniref:non-specific serine/threonine protein kinase n=1 Tax=Floridaenema fluviatile BLCC-F154 TaxID=3153640 RepID=A0ABV4YK18_9CYAN
MLGKLLGARYQVIQVLGAGGFGETYIAEDRQRPGYPRCVVKRFRPTNQNTSFLTVARRLFYTEAETLEKLGRHDQIPRLLAYFEEEKEFYLVQEFIEGLSLNDELRAGKKQSEAYVFSLLEDVLGILSFVHNQGVIHRDIKPSNLIRRNSDGRLVLIDFGAVKSIETQMAGEPKDQMELTVGIGTQGYMPCEQLAGKPRFNSDIYAVGMIGIKALTGLQPLQLPNSPQTHEIVWQNHAQVSPSLAGVLDKMVRYHSSDRYQSASQVLEALGEISSPVPPTELPPEESNRLGKVRRLLVVTTGLAAVILLVFWVGKNLIPLSTNFNANFLLKTSNQSESAADRISFGTQSLTPWQINPYKQEGIDLIKSGAYEQAISALKNAIKVNRSDPETLIYLHNAQIGNARSYSIAVVVPLVTSPQSSLEMLRGVAQAQSEINAAGGINGIPLKVGIAHDDNQAKVAQSVAQELVKNADILGVVGHGISDTTLAAASVYEAGELVTISPISSAVQLSGFSGYIFRTMPSDRFTARALSNYMLTQLKKEKVVVFYNSASVYSKSLKDEFKNALFYAGKGKVLSEIDLARPDFNAKVSVDRAIEKGAEVILTVPSSDVADRALQVIHINRRRLSLLAGDGFYSEKTLEIGGEYAAGMVLAIPGNITGKQGEFFQNNGLKIWGGNVNWRTALAYDATKALVAAIGKNPTRKGVQRSLSAPNFIISGATGDVSFRATGDREAPVQLVIVTPKTPEKPENGYQFTPLK